MSARIVAVARDGGHRFSKPLCDAIRLIQGLGIEGDAHAGAKVQHLSRIAKDPSAPNLRQVHLIHAELLDELAARGFALAPGEIGENVTTRGIDLLGLPRGTLLSLGGEAVVEITGLRNPCRQLDRHAAGLTAAVLDLAADGSLVRKAGIMAIVVAGGVVRAGDPVSISLPPRPFRALEPV